jgi:lantibiotic modifying enzyme
MQELREKILDCAYKFYTTQQALTGNWRESWNCVGGDNGGRNFSENFITGRVGYLFYLLQLYQISGDAEVGKSMEETLDNYEHFIKDIPTNNYTLTGRLGLGYHYLELFSITRERKYVDKALDMARAYYDGYSFQYGIINGSSLFEGVAGILNFTQQLYLETKEPWLLPYIEKWVIYLTTAAISAPKGFHWGGLTDRRKRNSGLITGAAGIAFV